MKRISRMTGRSTATAVAIALAAGAALAGCGGGSSGGGSGGQGGSANGGGTNQAVSAPAKGVSGAGKTTVVGVASDWTDFDIQVHETGTTAAFLFPGYDRLLAVGPDGKLVPYLASSWKTTPTQVTFTLRDDATCDDGTKITPQVVLDSFKRLTTVKQTNGFLGGYFGPGPYTLSADDAAGTFTFKTKTPYRNLQFGFANAGSVIVCPAGLKDPAKLQTGMYGSGPYTMESAVHGDRVTFKKRADWNWGPKGSTPAANLPDTLVYRIVTDPTTMANLVNSGEVNFAEVDGAAAAPLKGNSALAARQFTNWIPDRLAFNTLTATKVTSDKALRQAMIAVIDRKDYRQTALNNNGTVTASPLDTTSECYDPSVASAVTPADVDKAKQILASGGYTLNGGKLTKDGKPVKIRLLSSQPIGSASQYIAGQWAKLGITVQNAQEDGASYARDTLAGDFDATVSQSSQRSKESVGLRFDLFSGPGLPKGYNTAGTGLTDRVYGDAVDTALATTGDASCKAFATVQQRILADGEVMFLATSNGTWWGNGADDPSVGPFYPEPTYLAVTK
jgi:peptide/nickel transport system substrate-binding protein